MFQGTGGWAPPECGSAPPKVPKKGREGLFGVARASQTESCDLPKKKSLTHQIIRPFLKNCKKKAEGASALTGL